MSEYELPPKLAQRYRVVRPIAGGAFGFVVEAMHLEQNRPVALKLMHGERLTDPSLVKRFKAEAQLTAALQHPNIVRVVEHDVEDGTPWIAYELLTGGTLGDQVKGGPLDWRKGLAAGAQIAAALECAHKSEVVHRDIKSANVMVAGENLWKVTDFGLAKYNSDSTVLTAAGARIGTPAYMSPELVSGEPATPSDDLYALGVLLHEIVCGEWPFDGSSPIEVMTKHLKDPPPRPSERRRGLPPEVDAIILKLLAKKAKERPASAAAARAELEAAIATGRSSPNVAVPPPDAARSPSTGSVSRPRSRPSRAVRAIDSTISPKSKSDPQIVPPGTPPAAKAGIVALVLAVAGLGAWLLGGRGARAPEPARTSPTASAAPAVPTVRLPEAVRSMLEKLTKECEATRRGVKRTFGAMMDQASDFVGLTPAELATVRDQAENHRRVYATMREKTAAALDDARAVIAGGEAAALDDLFAVSSISMWNVVAWLESTRGERLAAVLEKQRLGAKGRANRIEDSFTGLATEVCFPPDIVPPLQRHADLVVRIGLRSVRDPGTAAPEWPDHVWGYLWLAGFFEQYLMCRHSRGELARRVTDRVSAGLAEVKDEPSLALRELLLDLWAFGAQVDAATAARRAQRAIVSLEKLELLQPQSTKAWRRVAKEIEQEQRRLATAGPRPGASALPPRSQR